MTPAEKKQLIEAVGATAELTGTELSSAAKKMMVDDLTGFPLAQVLPALVRCRRELKGRLTIAAIIERIDDGRPGPEQAWAAMPAPGDEESTFCWTDEMRHAWGDARPLIDAGDKVAARMAFTESYRKEVTAARNAGRPVHWEVSPGRDPLMRETVIQDAYQQGRIGYSQASALLPHIHELVTPPQLTHDNHANADRLQQMLAGALNHSEDNS